MHAPRPGTRSPAPPRWWSPGPWCQAFRPLAAGVLWPPILFGVCLLPGGPPADASTLIRLVATAASLQAVILFANDLADRATDRANHDPPRWSGGSRVLVQGRLAPVHLAIGLGIATVVFAGLTPHPGLWPWSAAALGLVAAYNAPPVHLSHHPAGAALQGLGLGVVAPGLGLALVGGTPERLPWILTAPGILLGLAQGIASALPDLEADRAVGKRTWAVAFGARRAAGDARALILLALAAAPFSNPYRGEVADPWMLPWLTPAALCALLPCRRPRRAGLQLGIAVALGWSGWAVGTLAGASR